MAMIRDYTLSDGPARGVRVIVRDDAYRGAGPEAQTRRRTETARAMRRIEQALACKKEETEHG